MSRIYTQPLSALDWGSQLDDTVVTYAFGTAGTLTSYAEEVTLGRSYAGEEFTAFERAQFRAVFQLIENVTNLNFIETDIFGSADLRLLADTDQITFGDLGVMVPPGESGAGIGVFNAGFWDRQPGGDLDMGGFSFTTILHEVLHGLGMAHPHDNGGAGFIGSDVMWGVYDAFGDLGLYDLNQGVFTVMTYNTGVQSGDVGAAATTRLFGYEAGPMALDIALLQAKYGANTTFAAGNNVYDLPGANTGGTRWMSIWDAGGNDLIRYQGGRDVTIDLRAATLQNDFGGGGYLSAADGIQGGFTIANGVLIERAQGGGGADRLTGNGAANSLTGGSGNDTLQGGKGNDTLEGGADNDSLRGGNDNDVLKGGRGDDQLVGDAGNDRLIGGNGNDQVYGAQGKDTLFGGRGNDTVKDADDNGTFYGNKGNDRIDGGDRADWISGGNGNDTIIGFEGNDTLKGDSGFDTFIFHDGFDKDRLRDLGAGDRLRIDDTLLSGQTTGAAVVQAFGSLQDGRYMLNFGDGDQLFLDGVSDAIFLGDAIDIF